MERIAFLIDVPSERSKVGDRLFRVSQRHFEWVVAGEMWAAGKENVQHPTETVQIGSMIGRARIASLLGSH